MEAAQRVVVLAPVSSSICLGNIPPLCHDFFWCNQQFSTSGASSHSCSRRTLLYFDNFKAVLTSDWL